jgi:hypothetical protein
MPIASATNTVSLPVAGSGMKSIPKGAQVGVRWDPILLDPQPDAATVAAATSPTPSPTPSPSPVTTSPSDGPGASPTASATTAPAAIAPSASPATVPPPAPPEVDLVVPEQLGTVVSLHPATRVAKGLNVAVTYPTSPGLYRLVLTIHNPAGLAYDEATQAMLKPVIVRVGGPFTAAFGAPTALALGTGQASTLAVRVVNAGSQVWDAKSSTAPDESDSLLSWLRTNRIPARVVATWVSTTGQPVPVPASSAVDPRGAKPGGDATVLLHLVAPPLAGQYLLLLDVTTPNHGALSTLGSAPALIRVSVSGAPAGSSSVGAAASPSASPAPSPSASASTP